MKKNIIRSILKQVQDGAIPREAGVRLCYEIRDLPEVESTPPDCEEVAIIGVAGRYPQAANIDELWQNLKAGRDSITEIPLERWDWRDYYNSDPEQAGPLGKSYCKWGGFIDGYDTFDPFFFNLSPREAGYMDLQERLFLEVAWESLEDAGYTRNYFERRKAENRKVKVGVFVGATWQEGQLYTDTNQERDGAVFSTHAYSIANRVSFFCNFEGPSLTIDTACSSSLTAIHLAWESIVNGAVDMAMAGGVNLSIHPNKFLALSGAGFASKKGRCQSFGSEGDGYVPGEGVGALLLKTKAKAIADGDHIYGIIKGSAINHGGKTNGYTIPSPAAQADVVREALRRAKIDSEAVSYIEAHGTGTALGDPIEIAGLTKAFAVLSRAKQFCALGSIKANIGHCEAAAGLSGVTKVLLQLANGQLAPTIHAEVLNPKIDFENSPFRVQRELAEWKRPFIGTEGHVQESPRIAGVSSFGAGGANAHVVIEEYVAEVLPDSNFEESNPHLIVLSAKNKERLHEAIRRLLEYVVKTEDRSFRHLANLAFTLQVGRDAMDERLAFVANSIDELENKLRRARDLKQGNDDLFQGAVKRGEGSRASLEFGLDQGSQVGDPQVKDLLRHWVNGGRIDWEKMHQGKSFGRIRLPSYPFARERYPLPAMDRPGNGSADIPSVKSPDKLNSDLSDRLAYLPKWIGKPIGDSKKGARLESKKILLVHGKSTAGLANAIKENYRRRLPSAEVFSLEIGREIRANDSEGFENLLAKQAAIDCVYFLSEANNGEKSIHQLDLKESFRNNELQLLRLAEAVKRRLEPEGLVDFYILTVDTDHVTNEKTQPIGGGLNGLAYAIAQSDHQFRVRNIDLTMADLCDSKNRELMIERIRVEEPSDRGSTVKLSGGSRYERNFCSLDWGGYKSQTGLRRDGVYIILGGSGTVGGVVTRFLIENYQAKVVWIGRKLATDPELHQKLSLFECRNNRPSYFQADATDFEAVVHAVKSIKQQFQKIHGVIFAGVISFGFDDSLSEIREPEFERQVEVKTHGGINLFRAFVDEPLDFFCFFSSIQSFSFLSSRTSASYAAGITGGDAVARSLQHNARFPVGILHWSYWKASVTGTALEKSIQGHFGALEDGEAFEFFEKYTALLRNGIVQPLICMRASESVQALMNPFGAGQISLSSKFEQTVFPAISSKRYGVERDIVSLLENNPWREIDPWLLKLLFVQMRSMGIFLDKHEFKPDEAWRNAAGITEKYRPWWETFCLPALVSAGFLQENAGAFASRADSFIDKDAVWSEWNERKAVYESNSDARAGVVLASECLSNLPAILRGEVPATNILFPESSMHAVEDMYQGNALADLFNTTAAEVLVAFTEERLKADPETKIRLIEIGAGTGATTAAILPKLKPFRAHVECYDYTDISKAFLLHASDRFGAEFQFLKTAICNIEKSPEEQDFKLGTYDVLIATNVLHATTDIRRTLRHVKSLLKQNGILVLNEGIQKALLGSLTFGLLDGWWLYADDALRIPGSPLLDIPSWKRILQQEGFRSTFLPLGRAEATGQQILIAESDGVITRAVPESTASGQTEAAGSVPIISTPEAKLINPTDLMGRVSEIILKQMAKTLRASVENLDRNVPFSDYGMDSILGVGFVGLINKELKLSLNAAIIFDHSSVDRLAKYLLKTCEKELAHLTRSSDIVKEVRPSVSSIQTNSATPELRKDPSKITQIAVIGISGQFPGAVNVSEFWENLIAGRDGVQELDGPYLGSIPHDQDIYKWGGVLKERDCFDPLFFKISPREAETMHCHQRLVLQECWKGLEDAGYNPKDLEGSRVGIYVGAEPSGEFHASFTGSSEALIASRLSYFLDLKGPALVVNTGCSSSAAAIHLACENLRHRDSDMALACGVFAAMNQPGLKVLAEIGMLSPNGACRTFDDSSNGTVLSEGLGVVVLKRLEDAVVDGDPIYGVIVGSGMNQDGASNGITAPNGASQESLIIDVYRRYNIDPERIQYLEAHGTGTRLGDPVEANALVRAFQSFTKKKRFCTLGSTKSHIGHTSAAAGVIGLIRILLSIRSRRIPGLLHFKSLNPLIEIGDSAFHINKETVDWTAESGKPLMAAMSSFGHSGTNVHFVVQEHLAEKGSLTCLEGPYLVLLSAKDSDRLVDAAQQLLDFMEREKTAELADICFTLQVGREAMNERLAILVESKDDLRQRLKAFLEGEERIDEVFRSSIKTHREALSAFLSDDDTAQIVDAWFEKRKYRKLLDVWVKGLSINWRQLYPVNSPRRIHFPPYPFAKERYGNATKGGLSVEHAGNTNVTPIVPNTLNVVSSSVNGQIKDQETDEASWDGLSFLPRWEEKESKAVTLKTPRRVLLAVESSDDGFGRAISNYYRDHAPSTSVLLLDLSEDISKFEKGLDEIGSIDCLYFLSNSKSNQSAFGLDDLTQSLKRNELTFLRLAKALKQKTAKADSIECYILTIDNYRLSGNDTHPVGGGVTGLAYSLAQSDYRFRVRNIDLTREDLNCPDHRDLLLQRIHSESPSDRGEIVKFCGNSRFVRTFQKWHWANLLVSGLRNGGVYVILGGSGVVGGVVTRFLIANYGATVIWLGRKSGEDESIRSRIAAFNSIHAPEYLEADATQPEALARAVQKIKAKHGPIHGAIFSGLIFNLENSIDATSEVEFEAIIDLKAKGGLNFFNAFQNEPLDFLCYFSSVQAFSFLPARDSCGYAAGITFADTLAAFLRKKAPFPLGVINWGYWKESIVGTQLEDRLAGHFGFISDGDGCRFFEKFTYLLRQEILNQMVCLSASERVRAIMGCEVGDTLSLSQGTTESFAGSPALDGIQHGPEIENLVKDNPLPALDKWMIQLLYAQLKNMGALTDQNILKNLPQLRREGRVIEKYGRWWGECCRAISDATDFSVADEKPENVWKAWEVERKRFLENADIEGAVQLVERCLKNLPAVLRGDIPATDILFPRSSIQHVEKLHRGNSVADFLNGIVAEVIQHFLQQRVRSEPRTALRIIEIGAGTGGTTGIVLPSLGDKIHHIAEYRYTDLSKAFLVHGEKQFGAKYPCLKFSLWNVEASAGEVGFEPGSYDIVIATNVLHATHNIRRTLRNAKSALKRNGLLILNEGVEKSLLGTLTFGLLDGWWLFEDEPLRISGTPLLASETWKSVLLQEGFSTVLFPSESTKKLGHQIIVAESDGIIRHSLETKIKTAASVPVTPALTEKVTNGVLSKEGLRRKVTALIAQALAESLNIPSTKIDRDCSFSDYGIDSILGVSFIDLINASLGIDLNTAIIFDYATVDRLAGYALETCGDSIRASIEKLDMSPEEIPAAARNELTPSMESPYPAAVPALADKSGTSEIRSTAIAVIGISGQFPGAENIDEFWKNLMAGVDSVGVLPERYSKEELFRSSDGQPGYRWGGMLAGRDQFDPLFFRISPREAESMNPHQRLILQEGWKSLEDAGYNPRGLGSQRVGVYIGAEPAGYFHETFTGSSDAIVASRLSYYLNLRGPALVVNTGCSASAVAVHLACESLRNQETDMALAGGICATVGPSGLNVISDAGMLSPTGKCHSLDASADGTVLSEGVGVVVLKRLQDAISDGDSIYGVIQGSGMNQDGASNGITAPNGIAQEALITDVYRRFGINPEEIGYFETHGTGTRLGDPVEVNALVRAFKQFTNKKRFCALGTAKSHVGHTSAASGVVGLIKVLLSLKHQKIPKLLHFETINPLCQIEGSAFFVNKEHLDWRSDPTRARMAALNSFGHSGTNVHLVVSEHLNHETSSVGVPKSGPSLVLLSAKNTERLTEVAKNFQIFVESRPNIPLSDLAYTLQIGREAMPERVAFLVEECDELAAKLKEFISGKGSIDRCWKGSNLEDSPTKDPTSSEEDASERLPELLAEGKLDQLAEMWTQGAPIDWVLLYGETRPHRISLPTYPFIRDSYWLPRLNPRNGPEVALSYLHPLLHQNRSSFSQPRFTSRFSGGEFFFTDHQVQGKKVLPGVAHLEMARAAIQQASAMDAEAGVVQALPLIFLTNVVWSRPLSLEASTLEVHVGLAQNQGKIEFEIYTQPEPNRNKVVHSQGFAGFQTRPEAPHLNLCDLRREINKSTFTPAACYDQFQALGIDYGPGHKGLEELYIGDGQILGRVVSPSAVADTADRYVLHPGLLDSALQCFIGFVMGKFGDIEESARRPSLPFALERLEILAPCAISMWVWIRHSEGSAAGDKIEKFDIDLCDDEGHISIRMQQFSTRVLGRDLSTAPGEDAAFRLLTMSPVWNALPAPYSDLLEPSADCSLVVVGGTENEKARLLEVYPKAQILSPQIDSFKVQLQSIKTLDHLVWIAPEEHLDSMVDDRLVRGQADGVLSVFRITKTLLELGFGNRDFGWTFVTRNAQSISKWDVASPVHASVHGLVGSLAKEYPHWKIRLLDMESLGDWSVQNMFRMPFHSQGDARVHRKGEWFESALVPVREIPARTPLYRNGGVYVVIGGAGGIGEAWSRFVIEKYQARVVWVGRRQLDDGVQARLDTFKNDRRPEYIQANAANLDSLRTAFRRIKERHAQINGVIHSAIVLLDKSLANMDEERFRAGLEAKVDVSVRMAQVFGEEALDFMLFFSSIQSFSKAPGQSNYAAGCTFKDAYAGALSKERTYPVKVMNWGYWGGLGIVKDASYRERMAQGGLGSIEPSEGMEALNSLLGGEFNQLAFSKVIGSPIPTDADLAAEWMTVYPASKAVGVEPMLRFLPASANEESLPAIEDLEPEEMEKILLNLLYAVLNSIGIFRNGEIDRTRVHATYQGWLVHSLTILNSKGLLEKSRGDREHNDSNGDLESAWKDWNKAKKDWVLDEGISSQVGLLEACLRVLPEILSGKLKATKVLFPESSMDRVEGVYKGNPVADFFNDRLSDAVVAFLKASALRKNGSKIRILEVGAGTGGTTAGLLRKLKPYQSNIEEYCYTDISKVFLFHAEKHFVPEYAFVTPRIFDVSKPLEKQEISLDSYDIVIATNVLHATKSIRQTIRNVKATLHSGGGLFINEICKNTLFAHLTFGLLDGWWLYEDHALRIPGCPGLYPETWRNVLKEEGFKSITFPAESRGDLGQQIIIAESDGVVCQSHPASPVPILVREEPKVEKSLVSGELLREMGVAYIKRLIAPELRMKVGQLNSTRPLEAYGMDSILVVHLTNALRKHFEDITSTLFFEVQTIDALVAHLIKYQRNALARNVGFSDAPANPISETKQFSSSPASVHDPTPPKMGPVSSAKLGISIPARLEGVAIVGISGRFPQSRNLDEFWLNLKEGRNCITEIPKERWDWRLHFNEEQGRRGSYYSKWGGFISEADRFDPMFFQISPREAQRMDPQERIFLETAYSCIEDAGYTPGTLCESRRVGIFVGVMNSTYNPLPNYASIANRVSYQLDFQGPSLAVDTACSASLTAIHLAVESVNSGSSHCAIAGGVNLNLSPIHYMRLSEARMLSVSDLCKPFGAGADGMVDGEGVGAVLLKPLQKAIEDGDQIYGVIKGSLVNAGGKTNGYTVPNPVAQARLIAETLERAGVHPRTLSYIEAHGTGTVLGDPIEITGLTRAFEEVGEHKTSDRQFCAIGSVKSNIGHCESAAGMAGLFKILLQMKHGQLAPSLHSESPNPNINFARTPFFVQQKLEVWKRPLLSIDGIEKEYPRRAGISSFGAGGSNAHLVVEEFIPKASSASISSEGGESVAILLSARNSERLLESASNLVQFLEANPSVSLASLAYTLQVGREPREQRLAFTARSLSELGEKLEGFVNGRLEIEGVFRGEANPGSDSLSLFGSDEDLRETIDKWITRKKYNRLLELWVKGLAVDWRKLYENGKPARISLPTYPFARERHWHPEQPDPVLESPVSESAPVLVSPPSLRPVEASVSDFSTSWEKPTRLTLTPIASTRSPEASFARREPPFETPASESTQQTAGVEKQLVATLASALFMDPASVDLDKSFIEMGLDSIVGVEWIQALNKKFGLRLSVTKIYDHPNIRRFSAFLQTELKGSEFSESAERLVPPNGSVVPGLKPIDYARQLDDLSNALIGSLATVLMMVPANVGVTKSFVDLGLDSIVGVEWINAINKEYGLNLSVSKVYDYPNIQSFAAFLENELKQRPHSPLIFPPKRVTLAQPDSIPAEAPKPTLPSKKSGRIAIVGISGRYPEAENLGQYWKNLAEARNSIREIPISRWDVNRYYDPDPSKPGKVYCKSLGMLDDVDCFDPLFFMLSPDEAEGMDPQHRLFLEEGYRSFEDAGYCHRSLSGTACGVYLGIMSNEYAAMVLKNPEGRSLSGNSFAIAAARLSYFLNLKGPAIPVDTACSSSLVAAHLACQALLNREVDMALVGGVSLYLSVESYQGMCAAGMLAADGRCKPFDNSADGFIPGEGVGGMVLKRLEDAEADGDSIYGVIIGSGINQDGKTNGITAPSMSSQMELVRKLYKKCDIDPASIDYVEMHGTGTKLGDPIEMEALASVYREFTDRKGYCAIGSVKSNIGHTSGAAGIASVHKVLLCLKNRNLVPTLNYQDPNIHFELNGSPFYVNTEIKPWTSTGGKPRRAAISAFGFSGTNAHIVIEEYRSTRADTPAPEQVVIPLSAKNSDGIRSLAKNLLNFVQSPSSSSEKLNLADLAYSLQLGRDSMEERVGFLVSSMSELSEKLNEIIENSTEDKNILRGRLKGDKGSLYGSMTNGAAPKKNGFANTKAEHARLFETWIRGEQVDWQSLYANSTRPQRISLPGYPFAKERYWVAIPNLEPQSIAAEETLTHPLLQRDTSGRDGRKFSLTCSGAEFFLQGHVVNGMKVLPGSCVLEMARAALERMDERPSRTIRFKGIVWPSPFVVGEAPRDIHITLSPKADGEIAFEIHSEVDGNGKTTVHGAGFGTSQNSGKAPVLDLHALRSEIDQSHFSASECYAEFQRMGFSYGPAFQCIASIRRGNHQILAYLKGPADFGKTLRQFGLNATMIDGALQASIGYALGVVAGNGANGASHNLSDSWVPFAIDEVEIISPCDDTGWVWIRPAPAVDFTNGIQKLDIDLCDEQGRVSVRIKGYSSRPAKENVSECETGMWCPKWRSSTASGRADLSEWTRREIFSYRIGLGAVEGLATGASLLQLETSANDLQGQINDVILQVFERIKTIAKDLSREKTLIQVLVPFQGDAQLLSCLSGLIRTTRVEHPNICGQLIEVSSETSKSELVRIL